MTVLIKHVSTIDELHAYFRTNVGPLFCHPTENMLHRFRKMTGMVGVVHPITTGHKIKVDWSIDKDWKEVSNFYMTLNKDTEFMLADISVELPGSDSFPNTIPQVVDTRSKFDWRPNKQGHVVCIGDIRWTNYTNATPSRARLEELKGWVGIIIDRCDDSDEFVTVSFYRQTYSKTTNVPVDMLVRLPKSFRPEAKTPHNQDAAQAAHKNLNTGRQTHKKAKFAKGDVVTSVPTGPLDAFHGLIGIVEEVHQSDPSSDYGTTSFTYDVNFDTLPNRNQSLTEGEGVHEFCVKKRIREFDLKAWNIEISDRAFLDSYRVTAKRNTVWSVELQEECKVDTKSDLKKSKEFGVETVIKGGKKKITCRNMDYVWDGEGLITMLATMLTGLGLEHDTRTPDKPETRVYLYTFEFEPDVGKYIKYRILLGNLLKQKSKVKKFEKSLKNGKLRNPFQVRRYLKIKSLGHFYQVCSAARYKRDVSDFAVS